MCVCITNRSLGVGVSCRLYKCPNYTNCWFVSVHALFYVMYIRVCKGVCDVHISGCGWSVSMYVGACT